MERYIFYKQVLKMLSEYRISFKNIFFITSVTHLSIAVPIMVIILLFQLLPQKAAIFLLVVFAVTHITGGAFFIWLIGIGSNWKNSESAILATSVVSGQLYFLLLGGLLGSRLFQSIGTIVIILCAIIFFIIGAIVGYMLGKLFTRIMIEKIKSLLINSSCSDRG